MPTQEVPESYVPPDMYRRDAKDAAETSWFKEIGAAFGKLAAPKSAKFVVKLDL